MHVLEGRVVEIRLDGRGEISAWIACPAKVIPAPGQYVMAWSSDDSWAGAAVPLFPVEIGADGFLAVGPVPSVWAPGTDLKLRGPAGNGFRLPGLLNRLALAALGDCVERLLPLVSIGLERNAAITLYADCPLPPLPLALEISPLAALKEALPWADLLVFDLPGEDLPTLPERLGVERFQQIPCAVQALVTTPMPCAELADCGACAVLVGHTYKLACKDGPVFLLNQFQPDRH